MQPTVMHEDERPPPGDLLDTETPLAGRLLPPLLVAACVAADLAVVVWHIPRSGFPTGSGLAYLALAFSQIGLATIWASLARIDRLYHTMAAGSAIGLLLLALLRFEPAGAAWFLLIGIQVVALAVPLRLTGARLTREPKADLAISDADVPMQFSLGHVFLATSGVAVCLGLLRAVEFALRELIFYFSYGLLFAAIGWICVWAVYGQASRILRVLLPCVFGPAVSVLISWVLMQGNQFSFAGAHAVLNLLHTLLLAGSLLVLRIAGYRLRNDAD